MFIKAKFLDKNNYLRNIYKSYSESFYFKTSCSFDQDCTCLLRRLALDTSITDRVMEANINERIEILTSTVMQLGNQVEHLLKRVSIQNGSEVTLKCTFV